ncbi:MAG TPA: GMC family oxidoreductase [Lysobacter sp.]
MIFDYRKASSPADIEADICIIGSGAAGLAIAWAFLGTTARVCIVEGGGLIADERNQALFEGASVGVPEFDPGASRLRAFGGTCNFWGRGCIPLANLAPREWVPHSGWPIEFADLEPHYRRASTFCGLEPHEIGEDSFLTPSARRPLAFDVEALEHKTFASSPMIFGHNYRDAFERADNMVVLLHANLLGLEAAPSAGAVRQARIGTLDGRRGMVRARHYVLACGGIENARLLLSSNSLVAEGLGNQHDLVGRFFMDHPSGKLGTLFTEEPHVVTRPYDRNVPKGRPQLHPEICLSEQAQRTHRILSGRVRPFAFEEPVPEGLQALRDLRAAIRARRRHENWAIKARVCGRRNGEPDYIAKAMPPAEDIRALTLRVGLNAGDIAKAFGRKLTRKPTVRTERVDLIGYFEQEPNRDSRITLGEEHDALGLRKVSVDWRLTELDRHTYRTAAKLFGGELARACNGRFQPESWLDDEAAVPQVFGTSHHMGTTRMADDPRDGVVDRHCKVHGIDNLHIAGSSVFPTGSWAFPTFTIIALSLRLAEHLRTRLEHAAPLLGV